jgi:hypothetical protein
MEPTWTEVNDLNTARYGLAVSGTQTASYSSWRWDIHPSFQLYLNLGMEQVGQKLNDLNQARRSLGGSTAGTSTAALGFGGYKTPGASR